MSERKLFAVRRGATMNESYAAVLERVMVEVGHHELLEALGGVWWCHRSRVSWRAEPCQPDTRHDDRCHWAVPAGGSDE